MAKFPSQNKLFYQTGSIGTNVTALTSGTTTGDLNLPKDLSMLNRRGYASTTRKGVPLVFRCKIDYYLQDEDMNGVSAAVGTDFASTLDVFGCQNNWVMRNAAVKFHAAREKMFSQAGIKKRDRGAYAHEIRYNYNANADTWLTPIDGDGDAFTGGTWDVSKLSLDDDADVQLKLVGQGTDESADWSASALQIGFSYLSSRGQVPDDSNVETSTSPTSRSALMQLLSSDGPELATTDDIRTTSQGEQDNPPYDQWADDDINMDITEPVLLGRALASLGAGYGSCIVDIPFGLAGVKASLHDAAGTSVTSSGTVCVEVLDIYEMQG